MPKASSPQEGLEPRDCVVCGTRFQPYREFHITCGARPCRARATKQSPRLAEVEIQCKYCDGTFAGQWSGIGRPPPCPECAASREADSKQRKNVARRIGTNPARREVNLRWNLHQYGISPDDYRSMVDAQGNHCAICGGEPDPNGIKAASRLHVDHDHVTGKIRELLCNRCNQGIGYFRDDPALFHAAAAYIERHRTASGG